MSTSYTKGGIGNGRIKELEAVFDSGLAYILAERALRLKRLYLQLEATFAAELLLIR